MYEHLSTLLFVVSLLLVELEEWMAKFDLHKLGDTAATIWMW